MIQQKQIAVIFLIFWNQIEQTLMQGMPTSPCPKMFQYRFDGSEWFGMLSVRDPDHGQPLHLRVTLSVRGKPSTDYLGEIELLTRGQFQSDAPVLYKIKFPKTQFAPKLLQISINNHVVCLGLAEQSIFVTQIQLEHTRKFTFIPDDTSMPLTPGLALPSVTSTDFHTTANDGTVDVDSTDEVLPADWAFGSKHLPSTKFNPPMRTTKDICGTIDNRIHLKSIHGGKKSKIATGKFRSTAGFTSNLRAAKNNADDVDYHSDSDDDINNNGASIPQVTADFLDPLIDDEQHNSAVETLPPITRGAWPWLAAIYVNNLTSLAYQCGGTLISAQVVISSAHCFKMYQTSYAANEVLVFLGRHNLKNWNEEGSLASPVDDIFIHPDFDSHLNTYDADIAVLVLKNKVRFNAFIRPACLWTGATNTEFIEGEHGIVVGWGLSNKVNNKPKITQSSVQTSLLFGNVVPRVIDAPIVSNEVCFKADEKYNSLSSNRTFCAGTVGQRMVKLAKAKTNTKTKIHGSKSPMNEQKMLSGPCNGDSGAGLMILKNRRWMLRGTVSAALPVNVANTPQSTPRIGCNVNQYVIYTDVAKFLDWIFAFII